MPKHQFIIVTPVVVYYLHLVSEAPLCTMKNLRQYANFDLLVIFAHSDTVATLTFLLLFWLTTRLDPTGVIILTIRHSYLHQVILSNENQLGGFTKRELPVGYPHGRVALKPSF